VSSKLKEVSGSGGSKTRSRPNLNPHTLYCQMLSPESRHVLWLPRDAGLGSLRIDQFALGFSRELTPRPTASFCASVPGTFAEGSTASSEGRPDKEQRRGWQGGQQVLAPGTAI